MCITKDDFMAVRLYCANEDCFLTGSRWFYEYVHNKFVTMDFVLL